MAHDTETRPFWGAAGFSFSNPQNSIEEVMSYKIAPSTHGQLTKMFQHLYLELHTDGMSHEVLQRISLRKAMLSRFKTPEVIDALFGEGAYNGIKRATGPFAQWRKIWDRVQEQEAKKQPARNRAIEALDAEIQECLAVGLSPLEIGKEVQRSLRLSGWLMAS